MKYLLLSIFLIVILMICYQNKQNKENYTSSIDISPILYFNDFKKGNVLYTSDVGLRTLKINENANFLGIVNAKKMLTCDNFTTTTVNNVNFLKDLNIVNQNVNNQNIATQNVNGSETITELNVQKLFINPEKSFSILPKGIIVMWHGITAPDGWALCDGLNGTPDLTNRFILSSGAEVLNNKGGEDSVTLTTSQIPRHFHNGAHIHNASYTSRSCYSVQIVWGESANDRKFASCATTKNTNKTGGDKPHENRPPYYALAFIMKK